MVEADSTVLAESVLDVELFGHERGAFSRRRGAQAGLIELAANGTLFIDEVGVLSPKLQSKLLRALEHGSFFASAARRRSTSGSASSRRAIAICRHRVARAAFATICCTASTSSTVSLPPLRERAVDIPLIARQFLRQYGKASPPRSPSMRSTCSDAIRGRATCASSRT